MWNRATNHGSDPKTIAMKIYNYIYLKCTIYTLVIARQEVELN